MSYVVYFSVPVLWRIRKIWKRWKYNFFSLDKKSYNDAHEFIMITLSLLYKKFVKWGEQTKITWTAIFPSLALHHKLCKDSLAGGSMLMCYTEWFTYENQVATFGFPSPLFYFKVYSNILASLITHVSWFFVKIISIYSLLVFTFM